VGVGAGVVGFILVGSWSVSGVEGSFGVVGVGECERRVERKRNIWLCFMNESHCSLSLCANLEWGR